jgi:predicted phosphohydrolase
VKLAWISDCHFDFVSIDTVKAFARQTSSYGADAVMITGDISDSKRLHMHLTSFADNFKGKVYFTLGNHDIYYSTFAKVKAMCVNLTAKPNSNLVFLDVSGVQEITPTTCLVGNMGFYDMKAGSKNSNFILTDFSANLVLRTTSSLSETCKVVVEKMAVQAKADLTLAANQYSNVYFATHVPPYIQSSLYKGKISEPFAQPYFVNMTFGDMLLDVAGTFPSVKFNVFCGHTHDAATYQPLNNLCVYTAHAEYNYPAVWKLLDV